MDEKEYKDTLDKIRQNCILMDECNKTLKRMKKADEILDKRGE
jgi:hypothetical protein